MNFPECARAALRQEAAEGPVFGPGFRYGGAAVKLSDWARRVESAPGGTGYDAENVVFAAPDGRLEVRIELRLYRDFPAVEWKTEFRNPGGAPSEIVEDVDPLAFVFSTRLPAPKAMSYRAQPASIRIRRALGSLCQKDDFADDTVILRPRVPFDRIRMKAEEGRSSGNFLPFWAADVDDRNGWIFGMGWSGAWRADFTLRQTPPEADGGSTGIFELHAGMLETHFRVLPGETLRQPAIYVLERRGLSVAAGQNLQRRFMLAHCSPRNRRGEVPEVPVSFMVWGGMPTGTMLERIEFIRSNRIPYSVFWMDAGWYGPDGETNPDVFTGPWYTNAGNWRVNRTIHPAGLKPVTDAAHAAGMQTLLWLELERAYSNAPVLREHPEWFVAPPEGENRLLNLGCPEAVDWAIDTVSALFAENRIDWLRQDFNFNTLPFWREADAPDRIGVAEMRYVTGLYRLWDTLRERFPDLMIDNCASGGRRIDFETCRRAFPLWRSDMQCFIDLDPGVNQLEAFSLSQWVPLHAGGAWLRPNDDYDFLSALAAGVSCQPFCFESMQIPANHPVDWHRRMIAIARKFGILCRRDFYRLTADAENPETWCAWMFGDADAGAVLAFRRPDAPDTERGFGLPPIDAGAQYEIEDETGRTTRMAGAELAKLRLTLPPRGAALRIYRKLR